ncbi:MAG: hypothetical protein JO261_11875 [Alphaproteobacteria bacterium]|nr:hypothetical protein [Alphaproteobacteria bacterium]MBV9694388.1 hypothetical protein [Alphaproteobacteria bacterium]
MRRLLLLLPLLGLAGCVILGTKADRKVQNSPSFRTGYDDGCASATNEGANMRRGDIVRDDALYEADGAYRAGWANGHASCARMAPPGQSRGPLSDPMPGGGH